jgi:Fe-S cluster assembly protein SufD
LSESAKIYTRPQLEIYADDVKCGHGASVGQLDQEAIYYMRQRGVGEAEARRMQMQGFADDIVNHCQSATFRDFVATAAEKLISDF